MNLSEIIKVESIKVLMDVSSKRQAIEALVDVLVSCELVSEAEPALQAILEREATRTTGIGHGLAIPHGKTDSVSDPVIAIATTKNPIDFNSIDEQPVSLIILLLSPADKIGLHIQALARISRLMSFDTLRKQLLAAKTPEEVFQLIVAKEKLEIGVS